MGNCKIENIEQADAFHSVVTVAGKKAVYRREPCARCPWRKDATGEFPAEAFRLSAPTAYDVAMESFGCHESGIKASAICAGFLVNGAEHNMQVRYLSAIGEIGDDVSDGGHELHENYREMAIANGVDPHDPVLAQCRSPDE